MKCFPLATVKSKPSLSPVMLQRVWAIICHISERWSWAPFCLGLTGRLDGIYRAVPWLMSSPVFKC